MEGAHIRYNYLLQKKFGSQDLLSKFEEQWEDWSKTISMFSWNRWDLKTLWALAEASDHNVREFTRDFIEAWCEEVRLGLGRKGVIERLDILVSRQELKNKRKKARLPQTEMSVREWVGINNLSYRFPQVRRILSDLQEGLETHA